MPQVRENFATRVNSEILAAVRSLAEEEGRQLQALVDEAFADLIEKRKKATPLGHVMGAYLATHENYAPLYKKLAERRTISPWLRLFFQIHAVGFATEMERRRIADLNWP